MKRFFKNKTKNFRIAGILIVIIPLILASCKKLVDVGEPRTTVTTPEVFSTDAQANSVLAGIYSQMLTNTGNLQWSNGATTVYAGLSSDELVNLVGVNNVFDYQFFSNNLVSNNANINSYFWQPAYKIIYAVNAAIEGITASKPDSVKNELLGEAKFIRAFSYFYLTNLFGNVPLVLTTDFNQTALATSAPQSQIYGQIIQDLKDAQAALPSDYSVSGGERIRANRWAATALLARVYLYQKDWKDAAIQASAVIANNQYNLVNNLTQVFNANSTEAIWQLAQNNTVPQYNTTWEDYDFVPYTIWSNATPRQIAFLTKSASNFSNNFPYFVPSYYLSGQLSNAFEIGDQRKVMWLDSLPSHFGYQTFYYPFKYNTVRNNSGNPGGQITQYYMVLRLAEQYLIRAEAEANNNDPTDAINDLNIIRQRSGLAAYSQAVNGSLLSAIYHERQVELFAEWGHRWFDLKRWGTAASVLSTNKGITVGSNSLLYPIPLQEIQADPDLKQNPGY